MINPEVHQSNTYIIKINGYLKWATPEEYIQKASKGPGERFYVLVGGSGRSIGAKRCEILACGIYYLPKDHSKIIKPVKKDKKKTNCYFCGKKVKVVKDLPKNSSIACDECFKNQC